MNRNEKKEINRNVEWISLNGHLVENLLNALRAATALIELLGHLASPLDEDVENFTGILEAACGLHVGNSVPLDLGVRGLLLEDVDELEICRVGANAVDDRERELALRQILAHSLVMAVLLRGQVHVVVSNLKDETN